jgi:RNA polymerase I-specific transcription initiation factor RRN3
MVSLVPTVPVPAPTAKPSKPLLRRSTLSGTIRKADDAGLDADILSAPPSPSKRARVTFNPNVEEKVMEDYTSKGRSLDSVRAEVKRSIEAHMKGDSEVYDVIKEIFAPRRGGGDEDTQDDVVDMKTYLVALTNYSSLLNKGCSGLVKAVLACEWMGRDESFVKAYVHFLGSLASAQGSYVGMVLSMLVGHFYGGKTFVVIGLAFADF